MKDFTINGWVLRFDNGTSRIIRDTRGIETENALEGIEKWEEMAPWILLGGMNRANEKASDPLRMNIEAAKRMLDELSPSETVQLINAYVKAMAIHQDGNQPAAAEGEPGKKS